MKTNAVHSIEPHPTHTMSTEDYTSYLYFSAALHSTHIGIDSSSTTSHHTDTVSSTSTSTYSATYSTAIQPTPHVTTTNYVAVTNSTPTTYITSTTTNHIVPPSHTLHLSMIDPTTTLYRTSTLHAANVSTTATDGPWSTPPYTIISGNNLIHVLAMLYMGPNSYSTNI